MDGELHRCTRWGLPDPRAVYPGIEFRGILREKRIHGCHGLEAVHANRAAALLRDVEGVHADVGCKIRGASTEASTEARDTRAKKKGI